MKYTNHYNLSPEVVRAITKDYYTVEGEKPSDYSVTDLINPIQLTTLKKNFPNDLVVRDVVDLFYSFLGNLSHHILETSHHKDHQSTAEERIYIEIDGVIVSGKIDCYQHKALIDGVQRVPQVRDYKTTKVWNVMKGEHSQWELQTNLYSLLLREDNKPVEKIFITCILFDWKKNETYKQGYPVAPIIDIEINLWGQEDQMNYLKERVRNLEIAKKLNPDELSKEFPCSQEDMWQRFKDYAIIKQGADRATKTFDDYAAARSHFDETKSISDKTHTIERRVSARRRCFEFCDAAKICEQHKKLCKQEGVEHTYPNHDLNIEPLF